MINDGITKNVGEITSFLMIGQSNMAGRGDFGEVEPIVNKNCFMLRMGRWQPMSEPINVDRDVLNIRFHSGISLGASFADEMSKYLCGKVVLIPCADGGTRIEQWQPGEVLFDHAVMMTKLAMRTSNFGGIIWHQGESNCRDFDAAKYRELFLNTINGLRHELGAEDLPLVIGEISDKIGEEWNISDKVPQMNALLHSLADELPMCGIVPVCDLALKNDHLHFNSASLRVLGRRYFEKARDIMNGG